MGRSKTICRRIEMLNALSINKKSAIDAPIQTVPSLGRCRLIPKTNIHKAASPPNLAIWIYFATAGNRNAKGCFLGRLHTLPKCQGYVYLDQELCSSHVVRHLGNILKVHPSDFYAGLWTSTARRPEANDGKRAATRHDALGNAREPDGRHARMRAHSIGSRKTVNGALHSSLLLFGVFCLRN